MLGLELIYLLVLDSSKAGSGTDLFTVSSFEVVINNSKENEMLLSILLVDDSQCH